MLLSFSMSSKTFCDVCKKEIKDRGIMVWGIPRTNFCKKCWFDKKKWPIIHKLDKEDAD